LKNWVPMCKYVK